MVQVCLRRILPGDGRGGARCACQGLDDYLAHGGFDGLKRAIALAPAGIVQTVADSGLRGRGGATLPTGIKWKTLLDTPATQKYIAFNADEGDSGTFSDRITTPMIRNTVNEPWRQVSQDEALNHAASAFRRIQAQHGRGAVGGTRPRAAPTRKPTWCRCWGATRDAERGLRSPNMFEAALDSTPIMHVERFVRGPGRFMLTAYIRTDERTGGGPAPGGEARTPFRLVPRRPDARCGWRKTRVSP